MIKQVNVLHDSVNSVSLTNAINPQGVEQVKKSLTSVVKQIQTIVTKHQQSVAQVTKQTADGMNDLMTSAIDTQTIKEASDLLNKLKADINSATKASSGGAGTASKEVLALADSVDILQQQLDTYQTSTTDLAKNLGDVNDIYDKMNQTSGQLVDTQKDIAAYADDMSFATRAASKDYTRLAGQAERGATSFQSSADAMNSFVGDIQVASDNWQDASNTAADFKSTVEATDFSAFQNPISGQFDELNDAAASVKGLVQDTQQLGEGFGDASSQIDSASSNSKEMQKLWEMIAASVSPLPEMLKAMKVMVGQASAYTKQTGLAAENAAHMEDNWQNAVINAVAIRDATIETSGAIKRIYGPEIAGSVSKLEASTKFIDEYWDNIYNNARLAEGVNKAMGYEAVRASSGSAAIMGHIQFTKRLLIDQKSMVGKARVMQVMAQESIDKNNKQIDEIQSKYDAIEKKISGASKSREWLSHTETEKLKGEQANYKAQQKALKLENDHLTVNQNILKVVNGVTGKLQGWGAAVGIGVKADEKRLDLADKLDWVQKATAEKAWDVKTAADGLAESVGAVEMRSKRVDEYWGGIQANFKNGTGLMQNLLEGGLTGSTKQVALINTAQNLMKQQDTMANRIRAQRYIREERGRGAQSEIDKLEREWKGMDQAITDHNKGYIKLTGAELQNLKYRQKTIDAQRKALQQEIAISKGGNIGLGGKAKDTIEKTLSPITSLLGLGGHKGSGDYGESILTKAAFTISDTFGKASDFFTRSDKYAESKRSLQKQLLTMEEQSSRLSRESAKNNQSLANAIAGSYKQQRTAIVETTEKSTDVSDIYANIESTSAKILESWQKMADLFAKMNGMSEGGGLGGIVADPKDVKQEADGVEALAEKIVGSKKKIDDLFDDKLLKKWGQTMGREYSSIEEVITDPKGFKMYEDDILGMLTRVVQSVTGLSEEAARAMANKMIPELKEVEDAASGKGTLKGKGYFFDDIDTEFAKKTKTINKLMLSLGETNTQATLKNGIMDPDQMATAIQQNAERLSEMFNDEFFTQLKKSMPGHENDVASSLQDFMADPKLWAGSRDNIVSALAQQFAALNGESAEFNYRLAHELLPTLDEVQKAASAGEPISMDLKIDDIKIEDPEKVHTKLVEKIMKGQSDPAANALLMRNKGLEGRDYTRDMIDAQKATGFRALKQRLDQSRGKADTSALKSQLSFLESELKKNGEEYAKQLKAAADDATLIPLQEEKKAIEDRMAGVKADMETIEASVTKVNTENFTSTQKLLHNAKEGFFNIRDSVVGVLASAQDAINMGQAVDNIKALGREQSQLEQLQSAYDAAEKASNNVADFRYQSLAEAKKALDQSIDLSGNYSQGEFQSFLDKIKAIPQESARALEQVGQEAYSRLDDLNNAMVGADSGKLELLQQMAAEERQNIEDYKQMIQQRKGFDSGTAAKWQNRVGQISQTIQNPSSMKSGLMNTNFSDVLGNNFDDIQGKLLEFGGKLKGFGGVFKFLAENLGSVMAVLQGVNIGFDLFDRIAGKSPEQIHKYAEAIDRINDNISNMIQTASGATKSSIQQQVVQLKQQQLQAQITAALTGDAAIKMTGMGDKIKTAAEKALVGTTTLYGEMGEKAMDANKNLSEINKTLAQFQASKKYLDMIAQMNQVIDRAQQGFQDLMDIEGQKVQAEFEFNKEKRADQAEFDRQFKRDSEQKAMDLLYSQEDWAKQRIDAYKDNMQAILDIEKDYTKSIKDTDKDMNQARKDSYKQLMKEEQQGEEDYQKSRKDTETNYQDQVYENEKSYIKSMIQTQKDYAKERMRQERDLLDQLRDLEMNNDVLGYIQAQRDAEKQMKDADEDHNAQIADTKKQHEEERAENQKAHELEMADLEQQNAERIFELTKGYLEEQDQRMEDHRRQLDQMKIDAQERLDEQVKQYAKSEAEAWAQNEIETSREKERTALQKRYADEDRAMQIAANQASFDAQMQQFKDQEVVARNNLIEYYKSQGMTTEEAQNAADQAIASYHDRALKNLTTHGLNMAQQAQDNNDLMITKEIELGEARAEATDKYMKMMSDAIIAEGLRQIEASNQAAAAATSGSIVDNIGMSLSGIVAGMSGISASLLYGADAGKAAGAVYKTLRGAAEGGDFSKGEVIMVGEEGPELFVPHETGSIIPNDISQKIVEQGGIKAFAGGTSNVKNMKVTTGTGDPSGGRGFIPPDTKTRKPDPYSGRMGQRNNDPANGRGWFPPGANTGVVGPGTGGGDPGIPGGQAGGYETPTNTAPVIWTGGKPKAGSSGQGTTSVEVMPDSPDLVVSDMHYNPGTGSVGGTAPTDGTDWESELDKLGPGRDKLADTKKNIDAIQKKFEANWLKIASTNVDYQSKIGTFDKTHLEDLYKNTFESYSKDLKTRTEFADKMVMTGQTYNKDAYDNQLSFNEDSIAAAAGASGKQLEIFKKMFTGMIDSLTGGKGDAVKIIGDLTKGATTLLDAFNLDGTGVIKNFVDNAGGFLKNLFGASDKSDAAGKKTESGMSSIFSTITSFVSDVPGTTKDLMQAGLNVLQGKAPDFATAFKSVHDQAGQGIKQSDQQLMQDRKQAALDTAKAVYTVEQKQLDTTTKNVFDMSDIIGTGQKNELDTKDAHIGEMAILDKTANDNALKATKTANDQVVNNVKSSTATVVDTTTKGFTAVQGGATATGTSLVSLQSAMNTFTGNVGAMTSAMVAAAAQIASARNNISSSGSSGGSSGSHSGGGSRSSIRPSDFEGKHVSGGGRAGGGGVDPSHGYMVGERGPEWFQPNQVGRITTSKDLKALMGIIPKAYDAMMTDIRAKAPDYSTRMGPSISLRIDNLSIGADISRTEIESQLKRMQMSIVRTVGSAVG